jgi:hypothetical protein
MNIKQIFESKKYSTVILTLAALVLALVIFQAGFFVGFRKASFEARFGGQFVGRMGDVNMMYSPFIGNRGANPHGIVGVILSINMPKIMVKSEDGHEDTVSISSSTVVRQFRDNINADKLKINDNVIILGSPNEDGSINASLIRVIPSGTSTRPMPLQMRGMMYR